MFRALAMFLALWVGAGAALAQGGQPGERLRVLVKPVPPFVILAEDGAVSGYSIELWQALAERLGVDSDISVRPDLPGLLDAIGKREGDLAIAAVTITEEREGRLDFSHPYFRSGLQIMVPAGPAGLLARTGAVVRSMFASPVFRLALLVLVAMVLLTAHVVWLIERRRNPDFSRPYLPGLWDGIYWTMVTISTVGYGDKTPKTHAGRAVALGLMVFGYIAFAWFTATIASSMTVAELEGAINGPDDLAGKEVATVAGSTSEDWLLARPGVRIQAHDTIEGAYLALEEGRADAVVHDYPVLSYHVRGAGRGKVRLTGPVFQPESYGIVFPPGSALRERLNRALLNLTEAGELARLHRKWFDEQPN